MLGHRKQNRRVALRARVDRTDRYSERDSHKKAKVHTAVGEERGFWIRVAEFGVFGVTAVDFDVAVFPLGHPSIGDRRERFDGVEALMTTGLHLLGNHLAGRIALLERLDIAPIPEHTGVLIIKTQAIPADRFALWWIDLATGDSGRVRGARARGEIIPIRDSSAAWVLTARDDDREGAGLLDRASLSFEFVADLAVCAISPDGCHAVIIDPEDGSLLMATIDGTTITRRDNLGVTGDPWNLAVLAVLADGSAVIKTTDGDTALVQVFRVGAAPSFVLRVEAEAEVYVANDASIVVTIPWDCDDNRELTIYRPSAGEAPRTVSLGRGGTTACFAPGNQYFVVSVWADNGAGRVIAIDLANAKPVEIAVDVADAVAARLPRHCDEQVPPLGCGSGVEVLIGRASRCTRSRVSTGMAGRARSQGSILSHANRDGAGALRGQDPALCSDDDGRA